MLNNLSRLILFHLIVFIFILIGCEKVTVQPPGFTGGEVSFNKDIIPFFQRKCVSCHGGGISPDLREGEAYIALSDGGFVEPGNSENSNLIDKLKNGGSHAKYINPAELEMLEAWIEKGAEDN